MVKKNLYLVPLIILLATVVYATYIVSTTDIVFGDKHYLGLLFVGVSTIAILVRKSLGIYFTGITLLAGTLNFIAFTPAIEAYSFGFGFNDTSTTSFKIQLFSCLILLLYSVLNGKFLLSKINKKVDNNKATH